MSVKYQCFSSVSLMDSSWLKKKKMQDAGADHLKTVSILTPAHNVL